VPVGALGSIRLGAAERIRVGQHRQHRGRFRYGEQEVVVVQAALMGVRLELVGDLARQLEPPVRSKL
jgi:hypothetical protein